MPTFLRRILLAALPLTLAAAPAPGPIWFSPVADVVADCPPSLAPALHRLADAWRARTQVEVHIFTGPPGRLIGLIEHRARADLVIAEPAVIDTLRTAHLLTDEAAVTLGSDAYVLVVQASAGRTAAVAPEIALRIPAVVTDPTSVAPFDGQALIRRIAGGAKLPAPPTGVPSTQAVVAVVARDPGRIGLALMTDAAATPAVRVAATVPPALAPPVQIEVALTRNGQSERAAAFVDFITGSAARPLWRLAGLQTQ